MISIRMLKICDASICKPLELIFLSYLENRKFLTKWKKSNLVLAHKNKDEQNYRPISLPPASSCWKNIWKNIV